MSKSKYLGAWDNIKGSRGKIMLHQHVIVDVVGEFVFTACGLQGKKLIGKKIFSTYPRCEHCRVKHA